MSTERTEFVNFYKYLGLPMNATPDMIKYAFKFKFETIEKSLDRRKCHYDAEELITALNAFEILSVPATRDIHDSILNGVKNENGRKSIFDPTEEDNVEFRCWLKRVSNEFISPSRTRLKKWNKDENFFKDVAEKLYEFYVIELDKEEYRAENKLLKK